MKWTLSLKKFDRSCGLWKAGDFPSTVMMLRLKRGRMVAHVLKVIVLHAAKKSRTKLLLLAIKNCRIQNARLYKLNNEGMACSNLHYVIPITFSIRPHYSLISV